MKTFQKIKIIDCGLSDNLLKMIIDIILQYASPDKIILYGSRARGDYKSKSDIDIAIVLSHHIDGLKEILDEQVPTLLKFDVIYFEEVNETLKKEIVEEGIILYEKA